MLALEWYKHTPLPDAPPEKPSAPGLTELSERLLGVFDAGLHCDVLFHFGDAAPPLGAHRVVLRRNPSFRFASDTAPADVHIPAGLAPEWLRTFLRSHYVEAAARREGTNGAPRANPGPEAQLEALRREIPLAQRSILEGALGALDAGAWSLLRAAVDTESFADCALQLACGTRLAAHAALLVGAKDGHYFSGALRWPGAGRTVSMPAGLSREALRSLLRLRYGGDEVEAEHILEARHFAELLDWPEVRRRCEAHIEAVLVDHAELDTESLLAVVSHAEESSSLPPRLRAAALAAAVRQWGKVAEAASSALPASRCSELSALGRIRNRDGHICGSLEEYLHAAEDDLTEWERGLGLEAPLAARRQMEHAWQHWYQILFEYGHIHGASIAERWREKANAQRELSREERAERRSAQLNLPAGAEEALRRPSSTANSMQSLPSGRVWFEASFEWREVPQNAICPGGLEYRCDMQTGRNFARLSL